MRTYTLAERPELEGQNYHIYEKRKEKKERTFYHWEETEEENESAKD